MRGSECQVLKLSMQWTRQSIQIMTALHSASSTKWSHDRKTKEDTEHLFSCLSTRRDQEMARRSIWLLPSRALDDSIIQKSHFNSLVFSCMYINKHNSPCVALFWLGIELIRILWAKMFNTTRPRLGALRNVATWFLSVQNQVMPSIGDLVLWA